MSQRPGAAHNWDGLRREARQLENDMEASLNSFAKLGTKSMDSRGGGAGAMEHVAMEIETLLARLTDIVEAMEAYLASNAAASGNPTMAHTLERHSEILNDYKREFRKRKGTITFGRDHHELVGGGRIKEKTDSVDGKGHDTLYSERAAVTGATNAVDNTLSQGNTLREQLENQRAMFSSMMARMESVSGSMPSITKLMNQIKHKKRRDVLVLGLTVAVLVVTTIFWKIL